MTDRSHNRPVLSFSAEIVGNPRLRRVSTSLHRPCILHPVAHGQADDPVQSVHANQGEHHEEQHGRHAGIIPDAF